MKVLVAGPSCGGKTTYVRDHAEPGQQVLDFGDILEELGQPRYEPGIRLGQAQRLWVERLPSATWVVWTAPARGDRGRFRSQFGAQVIVVMASMEVCLARAKTQRPPHAAHAIKEWFRRWEPSTGERELIIRTDPQLS